MSVYKSDVTEAAALQNHSKMQDKQEKIDL